MRTAVFSTKPYDRVFLARANEAGGLRHEWHFLEPRLSAETAVLAAGCEAVCLFVNDTADAAALEALAAHGVRVVALRSAGFNHVDLAAAARLGMPVLRVPAYSPHGVAEHAVALLLALNRHLPRASQRVRDGNFTLNGLLGFDLHGKTVGVVGTGKIGACFSRIMRGFGCRVLAHDRVENEELKALGVEYVPLAELWPQCGILSLHCPLTPETHHLVNERTLALLPEGAMLINTSRGALVDTRAVIESLKLGRLGALALDVYEEEGPLFFEDLSGAPLKDDVFARLLTFPNVLITAHQAFFTREAMEAIAATTVANLTAFAEGAPLENAVTV